MTDRLQPWCPWSIRWHPDADAACDIITTRTGPAHAEHSANLPGGTTRIWWRQDDPRAWTGQRPGKCTTQTECVLPAQHQGGCQP